jgi:hypothetical protein
MKLNSALTKFLTNKFVLNIVSILALLNIIGYLIVGNLNSVIHFIIFAFLTRYFSKNMTIVLGVPLVIVNLLAMRNGDFLEGMTTNSSTREARRDERQDRRENRQAKIDNLVKKNSNKPDSKTGQGLAMTIVENEPDNSNSNENDTSVDQQGFEPGRRKNKNYNIDYATTIEDAYDELNTILGSDGIHRLTSDTQNLMKQQMQLAEAMKNMTPLVKSIAPMVENLKGMMGQMGDNKAGIMDLAKQFNVKN